VVFAVCGPETPEIVTVLVPTAAVLLAVKVNWAIPVTGFGEIEAVTPLGSPEAERFTVPVNPYSAPTETVVEADVP
jgi:hypothetical protein